MNALSLKIQKKLELMAVEFAESLPVRLGQIKDEAEKALSDDTEGLKEFQLPVHKLAGAGSTFGFTALSKVSKEMEHILFQYLDTGSKLNDDGKKALTEYMDLLENLCTHGIRKKEHIVEKNDDAAVLEPIYTAKPNTEPGRTIHIFDNDSVILGELSEQLEIFGFTIETVSTFKELSALEGVDSNTLVLVNTSLFKEDTASQEELRKAKNKHDNKLKMIFISEKNDFETRLQAIRAGGDDFFLFPVEIGRLIDAIDKLTERIEQEPYHVFIVDDDPEQVAFHAHILQQAGMITSVVIDPKNVIKVLVEAKPEIILMDMYMPGCSGAELATVIRQQPAFVSIPIVFLSVEDNLEKQMEALEIGADDFLTKPIKPEHLIASISNRLERTRGMRYLMERDSLTGLLNHTNLREQLAREVLRSQRTGAEICFAMIDVDHFKNVNDSFGHLTGDNVLKGLARLLNERLRKTDIIGRYGGEEFGAILLNTDMENASRIMNEIRENFSQIKQYADSKEFYVTFSCGIASYKDFEQPSELGEAADKAMYEAKQKGRNKVVCASKKD